MSQLLLKLLSTASSHLALRLSLKKKIKKEKKERKKTVLPDLWVAYVSTNYACMLPLCHIPLMLVLLSRPSPQQQTEQPLHKSYITTPIPLWSFPPSGTSCLICKMDAHPDFFSTVVWLLQQSSQPYANQAIPRIPLNTSTNSCSPRKFSSHLKMMGYASCLQISELLNICAQWVSASCV